MILMPFKTFTKDIQITCEAVYKNHDYIDDFDLLSRDIYEEILSSYPSKYSDEEFFRLCQHASLLYLWARGKRHMLFGILNWHFFFKFSDSVRTVATRAVDKALANGIINL